MAATIDIGVYAAFETHSKSRAGLPAKHHIKSHCPAPIAYISAGAQGKAFIRHGGSLKSKKEEMRRNYKKHWRFRPPNLF
jgi:hypothetical protein